MKIMILGGSSTQLPLLLTAKEMGLKIVLCDYAEDVIGREYSDRFYCVSTLDHEAIEGVAKQEKVDGILTNSEPAMPISAFVANKLDLPSNPYESIQTLSRKDLFRKFLKGHGFPCPQSIVFETFKEGFEGLRQLKFPVMVKPVDSSGSRGVRRIYSDKDFESAFDNARGFSRIGKVIIEEFIERTHSYMIGGDIFVYGGEVVFWGLMNSFRNLDVSEFIPVGTSYPTFISPEQFKEVDRLIHKALKDLKIQSGPFNLELMFGKDGRLYIIEMNPRSGGNEIPNILKKTTGVDLIKATIEASLGYNAISFNSKNGQKYMSTYVIHSLYSGVLDKIQFDFFLEPYILEKIIYKKPGDPINAFSKAADLIGILLLKFSTISEMTKTLENINGLIDISLG